MPGKNVIGLVPLLVALASLASAPSQIFARRARQSFYGPTEPLDPHYRPMIPVASRYADHFLPTMLTNSTGDLAEDVFDDLAPPQPRGDPGGGVVSQLPTAQEERQK